MKRKRSDTLRILHRLPDTLSGLVNEFANYGGLLSAPEIAPRRLALDYIPDIEYRQVIQPDEVVTWVDINGIEQPKGPTSWANELKAKACARISNYLVHLTRNPSSLLLGLLPRNRSLDTICKEWDLGPSK